MVGTYENIVLLLGEEAREAMALLDAQGEAAAMAHLKRWHEPGEGTLLSASDEPWRPGDRRFEDGGYVLYYNAEEPYIGLVFRVSLTGDA